jgi:calcium-dependent protein kinase
MGCGGAKAGNPDKKEAIINKNNFEDVYELKESLGSGTISEVWSAIHIKSGEERAVKIIKKGQNTLVNLFQMIKDETDSLATLVSENIVKIYEVFEDENKYYIVMELLKGPNMSEYLSETPKTALNEKIVAGWVKQVLEGISHCHSKEIVHRDIRPSNVVFADKEATKPKLIDFNFSQSYNPDDSIVQDIYAAPAYIAPEMLTKKEYSKKTDIWSCGILTYYIIAGKIPYKATKQKDLLDEIKNANFTDKSLTGTEWANVTPECKNFVARMLEANPEKRPTAEEMLSDAWLGNNNTKPLLASAKSPSKDSSSKKSDKKVVMDNSQKVQKFHHASLSYILAVLDSEKERENIIKLFDKMDKNNDKLLNRTELRNAMKQAGTIMSPIEFDKMFRELDRDGSGNINFKEYLQATVDNESLINDKPLKTAFNNVSGTNDNTIKTETLTKLMNEGWMSEAYMTAVYKDVNGEIKGNKV